MKTNKLTRLALLAAIALGLYVLEAQIPSPIPIAGIKLGLSNIVSVYAVFVFGPWEALAILLVRVFLGSLFTGQMMALAYSLAGGLLSWLVMLLLRRLLTRKQIWVASVIGGICHNVGQILVAIAVTATPSIAVYLPVLILSGLVAGLFTGFTAQYLIDHMKKLV